MPILLYDFEVLNLNKSQLNSLDFVANRFLMKLSSTNALEVYDDALYKTTFYLLTYLLNNTQIIQLCCE